MDVLKYIAYCFILPVSVANGYGYQIDAKWYDYVVSVFLYLICIGVIYLIVALLTIIGKRKQKKMGKEKSIKNFMDSDEEIDNKQEAYDKQEPDNKQ